METILQGRKSVVRVAPDCPTVLIGKRANHTRRKRLADELVAGCTGIARNDALAQVATGADVIAVDAGVGGPDGVTLLPRVVEAVQEAVEVPISIETGDPEALAAALAVCQGKPLVNAVTGAEQCLGQVLPLIARYGAAVVGRCEDEGGIPDDPYGRLEIARRIIERAEALGIPRADVVIDCLTEPVEVDPEAALITLETVRLVKAELEVNITLDVSAISSELPNCAALHQPFMTMAVAEGVNVPMVNVARDRQAILALDVLLGRDESAMRYIRYYHYRRSGMRGLVDWEMVG